MAHEPVDTFGRYLFTTRALELGADSAVATSAEEVSFLERVLSVCILGSCFPHGYPSIFRKDNLLKLTHLVVKQS